MPLQPKLLRRFFEVLVLLRELSQVQGDKIPSRTGEDGNLGDVGEVEMRRRVMYHLCVMCDFEKGGDSVTAIAAEALPCGPRYWVASNDYSKKIGNFLFETLGLLEARARSTMPELNLPIFEEQLVRLFIPFQRNRIKAYWKLLQVNISREMNRTKLSPDTSPGKSDYARWLEHFADRPQELEDLILLSKVAYKTRHSAYLRVDYDPVTLQPISMENESRCNIRHYLGRFCAPIRAAKVLAFAATSHGHLFQDFTIQTLQPSGVVGRPSVYSGLTLEGISGRMISNDFTGLDKVRDALQTLDANFELMRRIRDHYESSTWKPRVHAELALLEVLYGKGCNFYNDDRYIACSKAACFCCYHYVCHHPGLFAIPPSHNKIYLNWHPPELSKDQLSQQRDVMNKVIQRIRQAIIDRVLAQQNRASWHPDSTTGITTMLDDQSEVKHHTRKSSMSSLQNGHSANDNVESDRHISDTDSSEDGGVPLI